jgi:WD40 repeat protein
VKLIDLATGRLIDDVNRPRDVALSLAGNPTEDQIAYGDEKGGVRIHKMEPRGGRLAEGDDKENSYLRECERLPGAVPALAWSRDGNLIAAGCASGEARVFNAADGKRRATLKAGEGAIFVIAFDPEAKRVATGGYDGKVRVFDSNSGDLLSTFTPVPLSHTTAAQ